ncbi:SLAP domain-containing protein [Companilactobacillus kimchiensis]|nr:SLAP domain-containing protein [Companilactobacillus kimchiensis]
MFMNKRSLYLGVTLFSSMILATLSTNQAVKADTTDDTTSLTSATKTATSKTSSIPSAPISTNTKTVKAVAPMTTVETSKPDSAATGTSATVGTGTTGTTAVTTGSSVTANPVTTTNTTPTTSSKTSTVTTAPSTTSATTVSPSSSTTATTTPVTTTTNSYTIPSDVTDSTVVPFTDPLLEGATKMDFNLKPGTDLTVGDIKSYTAPILDINETEYQANLNPAISSMGDQQAKPVESLDGLQYLQLLPAKTQVYFEAKIASDAKSNPNLTPLDNLNLVHLKINGNFSDSKYKEIDANQVAKLKTTNATLVELNGDTSVYPYSGVNNSELKELGPWLTSFANNSQQGKEIELNYASVTDFSPLSGINPSSGVSVISFNDGNYDTTPAYGITGQPLTFTAQPFKGLDGEDLADTYHFTGTVAPAEIADDNLENLGNDKYEIAQPDYTANNLTYGDLGFMSSSNSDATLMKDYGTNELEYFGINAQPIIWQKAPSVIINYLNTNGTPLQADGVSMTKEFDGAKIGDSFDLTADSKVVGYNLISPITSLKGTYTENPQVIDLTYSAIPATKPTTTPTKSKTGSNTGVIAKTGTKFNTVISSETGIVRIFDTATGMVNAEGKPVISTLAPNTAWKYSKIVAIDGNDYYQVSTDEFVPVASGVKFIPVSTRTDVVVNSQAVLYDAKGQSLGTALARGSRWATDGCAIINGVKMYRVATDEWISNGNVASYEPVASEYHATLTTPLYDINGNLLTRKLPAGTAWKVDEVVENSSGEHFYRVSTDEFVRDYIDDVR